MADMLTIGVNKRLLLSKNHTSGVILESDRPFNGRKKTCSPFYRVIYGSEVLVRRCKISHAWPGLSPQREEAEIENRPQCVFLLRRQEQKRKVRNRMEDILAILNIILCMLCDEDYTGMRANLLCRLPLCWLLGGSQSSKTAPAPRYCWH